MSRERSMGSTTTTAVNKGSVLSIRTSTRARYRAPIRPELRMDPLSDKREADPVAFEQRSIEDLTIDERCDLLVQEYLTAPLFHHLIGGLGSVSNLQT